MLNSILPCAWQVPGGELDAAIGAAERRGAAFSQEYGLKEPQLAIIAAEAAAPPAACLSEGGSRQLLDLLLTLPHGVVKNSHAVEGERGWGGGLGGGGGGGAE